MKRAARFSGSFVVRLVAGYVLVAIVFAAAWTWTLYGPITEALLRQQQRNLTAVAQSAALVVAESNATPQELAKRLVARTELRMTMVNAEGVVLADSTFNPKRMENHGTRPEVAAALAGEIGTNKRMSRTAKVEELYVAVPGTLDGRRVAIRMSQPLSEIQNVAATARSIGMFLLLVAVIIAVVIGVSAARIAARPVRALSATAQRMADGNLGVEVPRASGDLQTLADALTTLRDQMRARLEALDAEGRTLRAALDGLGDAVFLLEGETVVLANRAASTLFRAPTAGWTQASIGAAGLPAPLAAAIQARCTLDTADTIELETDPTGRTLRLVTTPLPIADGPARCLAVVRDVTERSRIDKVRRDFVANASHELKTPVAGIRLLAQTVQSAAEDGEAEQALAFALQIEAETARLQNLVTDLLDLSRLESAPAPDALTDVRQTVDRAVTSHHAAAARKGLELVLDLDSVAGVDVYATADPTDVVVALDNLIDNAIAYTDEGSVTVSVDAEGSSVAISVTDTGPGIAPEHRERVFERFYRVDGGRSREHGGTGLGLSLVKHVAERSGGSVSLASKLGAGSMFTLRFPRAR
jgi:two-component system phosphate regulon sensor histidine kinase PhoR